MKKFLLSQMLLSAFFLSALNAQTTDPGAQPTAPVLKREVGIRMSGFDNFDFIYKKQKAENKYSRIRLVSTNFSISDFSNFRSSLSMGLAYGREKRTPLNNNFSFIRGWELIGRMHATSINDRLALTLTPGIGLVLGFQYDISEKFGVNIETIPSMSTDIRFTSRGTEVSNFNFGFNSNSIALGLMYRF
jgi:hypothetical protein